MSLGRLALRLATIDALRPHAAQTADPPGSVPWPTLAKHRVFGSMAAPIDDLVAEERAPVIVVYTEEDAGKTLGGSGAIPHQVALVFEISLVQRGQDPDNPDEYVVGEPATDEEAEAELDLLEAQIKYVLLDGGPTGRLWRTLTGRQVASIESMPQRTAEEAVRLASRKVTWAVSLPPDCYDFAAIAGPAGLDRLPEPLRSVAKGLPAVSEVLRIASAIATGAPVPPVLPRLAGVGVEVDAHRPPTGEPDITAQITIPQE